MTEYHANLALADRSEPLPSWQRPSICQRPQRVTLLARLLLWLAKP